MVFFKKFEEKANCNPESVAIIYAKKEYTYKYLLETIEVIYKEIVSLGINEGDIVALKMRCSFMAVAYFLAIWRIGATVITIDEDTPELRIDFYVEQAKVKLIIAENDGIFHKKLSGKESVNFGKRIAYLMFTSGSTGTPKAVQISYDNIVSLMDAWQDFYKLDSFSPKVLQLSSISTDMFIGNLIKSLFWAGTLIIVNKEDKLNLSYLVEIINIYKPNIVESTPSYIRLLLEATKTSLINTDFIRQIIFGGEACSRSDFGWAVVSFPKARVINGYGLTECTIESVVYEAKSMAELEGIRSQMLIGSPLKNTQVLVVNDSLVEVQEEIRGELLIAGEGVSFGYLDEKMNEEKFVFIKDKKWYRTGDMVQKMSSGDLLFLGREDDQVQVNGYRIELAEINRVSLEINGVKEAVVLNVSQSIFVPRLVIFIVSEVDRKVLFAEMKSKLAEQMIPSDILYFEILPKTIGGKIDRQALISLFWKQNELSNSDNSWSNQIILIIEDVLGKKIVMDKSIVEQGADSLSMIRIMYKLQKIGFSTKIADMYSADSITSFLRLVSSSGSKEVAYKYSTKDKPLVADFIKTKLSELRQREIEYFNRLIESGIEDRIDLEPWRLNFRNMYREKYSIDYLWCNDYSFDVLNERHNCLLSEQQLLRASLVTNHNKFYWAVFKMPDKVSSVVIDLSELSLNEAQIMKMLPFIKEYYLAKDRLKDFPYRHIFVRVTNTRYLFVFCMDESIHNKVGADILKSYFFLGSIGNNVQYEEYLKLLRNCSLLNEEEIVREFKLDEFNRAVSDFPKYLLNNLSLYEHAFDLEDNQDSLMQSLEIFSKITKMLIDIDTPFFMVQDTRAYQEGRFVKTIGEFTDFIPCVFRKGMNVEELFDEINFIRKKAAKTLTNFKSLKWLNYMYKHPTIHEGTSNVSLKKELLEPFIVFHYRTEVDESTELYSTIDGKWTNNTWPSAITFSLATKGDKLILSAYLPCSKDEWGKILREINDGKV